MQKILLLFTFSILLITSCNNDKQQNAEETNTSEGIDSTDIVTLSSPFDLGKLIVLIDNNSFSYNHYKDTIVGFEYEILNKYCLDKGLELEFIITQNPSTIIDSLSKGAYHMAASNLNITAERKKKLNFSHPYTRANELLVQRLPKNWEGMNEEAIDASIITDRLDFTNEDIFVKKNSSHVQFLTNLKNENGLDFRIVEGDETENIDDLVEKVNSKQIDYCIISSNAAIFYKNQFPNLDFKTAISLEHPVAFPIKKDQSELLSSFNNWLDEVKSQGFQGVAERF